MPEMRGVPTTSPATAGICPARRAAMMNPVQGLRNG